MSLETEKRYYTIEEYLELEETAEERHEYRDGLIISMTGGTTDHNQIALNLAAYLLFALKAKGYKVYIGDVKVWIPRYRIYTYPDVMVIEGQPLYEGKGKIAVTNPSLIVEVLSKSTKNYDLDDKFRYYRSIPEFKEYISIEQKEYRVLQYNKMIEEKWMLTECQSEDAILSLSSLQVEISLRDLYAEVDFV
jgi:Uma2 family endonuclease